jgi:hypothetical protein
VEVVVEVRHQALNKLVTDIILIRFTTQVAQAAKAATAAMAQYIFTTKRRKNK